MLWEHYGNISPAMTTKSRIEWTEHTWNPVTGCTELSSGCARCYAKLFAERLQAMGVASYSRGFEVTVHESRLKGRCYDESRLPGL